MKSTSIITADCFDRVQFQNLKVTGEIDSEILEIQEQTKKTIKEM